MNSQNMTKHNLIIKFMCIIMTIIVLCIFFGQLFRVNAIATEAVIIGGALAAFLAAFGIELAVTDMDREGLGNWLYDRYQEWSQTTGALISVAELLMYDGYLKLQKNVADKFNNFADWFVETFSVTADTPVYDNRVNNIVINNITYNLNVYNTVSDFPTFRDLANNNLWRSYFIIPQTYIDIAMTTINNKQVNRVLPATSSTNYVNRIYLYLDNNLQITTYMNMGLQSGISGIDTSYINKIALFYARNDNILRIIILHRHSQTESGTSLMYYDIPSSPIYYSDGSLISATSNPDLPVVGIDESVYIGIKGQYQNPTTVSGFGELVLNLAATNTLVTTDAVSASDADVDPIPSPDTPQFPIGAFADVWKYVRYLFEQAEEFFDFVADMISCLPQEIIWCIYGAGILMIFGGVIAKLLI